MAESNRVFVSPGIYTSEKDLTFVAQSVGVSTLGLAGETLKGPAFEPILIKSFDEFKVRFGGTTPEKYSDGNPKYELPYVAKSYLQESNQLFVSRVLGLTGYRPEKTFAITTLGSIEIVEPNVVADMPPVLTDLQWPGELSGYTSIDGINTVTDYIKKNLTGTSIGTYFTIGKIPSGYTPTTGNRITGPIGDFTNYIWSNKFYNSSTKIVKSYLFISTNTGFNVTYYEYNSNPNKYDGLVAVALRSRGSYTKETLNLKTTGLILTNMSSVDPLSDFTIKALTTNGTKSFNCSLNSTSTKNISKVLGVETFDKDETEYPLYVYESYPNFINALTSRGLIRGLKPAPLTYTHIEPSNGDTNPDFNTQWETPISPMVVSEVRGNDVHDLFEVLTLSDGESANKEVKISIINVNLDNGEFDLIVRDFNDTDDNQVVLEKFSRCSMNPDAPGYIALKIGTYDGDYELKSKYIMLSMALNAPSDAIPSGFKGFITKQLSGATSNLGNILYKTDYYDAGEVTSYTLNGTPNIESGDKIRKVTLGMSSQVGFDQDLLKFKGKKSNSVTPGFHLSVNAATISGNTFNGLAYQTTPYDLEGADKGKLEEISYRKFTFAVCGGFDGWDIYRKVRTNTDKYVFGKKDYVSGSTTNLGAFNKNFGNSDYYAYEKGITSFSNPEAFDINIFATPGINFYDHSSLVSQTIDMIENDRSDSLYVVNSPMFTTADEVITSLDTVGMDSNYSATYWPWIQVRDSDNSTQLYLPPTGEVVRNLALTDNVAYPWFATAGYSRGLVNSIKASKKLTLDERDSLYKARINPIATFADTGTIIWGNKTLQVRESALDRINVRRLLLRTRKLISAVAVRLLFEQNDDQVRQEFKRLVNPILESIKKERGLYDFRVVVSDAPEDIDNNTLRGYIYIKPTRSLEFISVDFIISPTGASFENI